MSSESVWVLELDLCRVRIAHNALFVVTDVGGGNKKDNTEDSNALSNISLRWMVQEVVKSNCDVKFAKDIVELLQRLHIPVEEIQKPDPVEGIQAPLPADEQLFDTRDAEVEIDDELACGSFFPCIGWWFLEVVVPTYYEWQEKPSGDGQTGEQWVWFWTIRQVTHPLFRILAIVLTEYHDHWSTNYRA